MQLKNRRQSDNIQTLPEPKVVASIAGRDYVDTPDSRSIGTIADQALPGHLARQQLEGIRAAKVGRAMGVGNQLDVIEKMGKPTSDGVTKDRLK